MSNPYLKLDDFCHWSRAMTWPAPGRIDPVVDGPRIEPHERVATMGSCFAQHIARRLTAVGLHHFVTERADPSLPEAEAIARNYGVYSARYGNIYTARQALQLFQRAFGSFVPRERAWRVSDGFVDPFRPRIEPAPFSSIDEVEKSAAAHLSFVREVFEGADWMVFTLGLTEAFRSRADGAVYPIAPGVAGGDFDPDQHELVNFGVDEVRRDLEALIAGIREVNPGCRVLLTVSPVPLIATAERRHVLTATTYSKAVLRVAAHEAEQRFDHVFYFPAYEVITSPAAAGRYYADDLRQVTELGVSHVMRLFETHYVSSVGRDVEAAPAALSAISPPDIVCDEEAIAKW